MGLRVEAGAVSEKAEREGNSNLLTQRNECACACVCVCVCTCACTCVFGRGWEEVQNTQEREQMMTRHKGGEPQRGEGRDLV